MSDSVSLIEQGDWREMDGEKWDWLLLCGCIFIAAVALAVARLLPS